MVAPTVQSARTVQSTQSSDRSTPLRHRAMPAARVCVAHVGLPARRDPVHGLQLVEPAPEPDGQAGRVGRPQRARLEDRRRGHRSAQDVRLELHQELVAGHPAVHAHVAGQRGAQVRGHRLVEVVDLVGGRLEGGARDVRLGGEPGEAGDHPARIAAPARGEQPAERRDEDHVPAVRHARGERLDLGGVPDDAQVIAKPLDQRAGDRHRALEGVGRRRPRAAESRGHRGDESMRGVDGPPARVHQLEAPGPVGALDLPGLETRLAEQGRLLVAEVPRDRYAGQIARARAVHLRRATDLGQHGARDAELVEDRAVPRQSLEVHEHRPRGVRDVRDVDAALDPARQVPDEPAVDRAEEQVAPSGRRPAIVAERVEDPGELEPGRIRGDGQPGRGTEPVQAAVAGRGEPSAHLRRARVLPHDGGVGGTAGAAVPHDGRLTLVADPDRRQRARVRAGLAHRDAHAGAHALDDLVGVVLDPAGTGRDLRVLQLVTRDDRPGMVEEDAAAARRPLVDGGDERPRMHLPSSSGSSSVRSS